MMLDHVPEKETRFRHRRGEPITNFPWVRQAYGFVGRDPRVLAYIDPGDRHLGKRIVLLNEDDYQDGHPYRDRGDCPVEAILPASFAPGRKPVPAYPVHLILSNWWALGVRLRVDEKGWRFVGDTHEDEPHLWPMVRGTLHSMKPDDLAACRLWIASYWAAPEAARWRWEALGEHEPRPRRRDAS